jgi:uncharacterized SAM-binding protein YcdF (DUF218 family)
MRIQLRLLRRRMFWCPTWSGLICFVLLLAAPMLWWWLYGESFLSSTSRLPAEILVVEGWIGRAGVDAAAKEFEKGDYQYVVTTGGLFSGGWEGEPESYAVMAQRELIQSGVAENRIIAAPSNDTKTKRTFESAVAAWCALQTRGLHPKSLNVFTFGPHARRSRMVFAKVCRPEAHVGVISWVPADDDQIGPWWRSSERAKDMLGESAGYLYEVLFNCGRHSNSPARGGPRTLDPATAR